MRKKLLFPLFIVLLAGIFIFYQPAAQAEEVEPKVVILCGSEAYLGPLVEAYNKLTAEGYHFQLKLFNPKYLTSEDVLKKFKSEVKDTNILLLEMVGGSTWEILRPVVEELPVNCQVVSTRGTPVNHPRVDESQDACLRSYFDHGGLENMRRLLLYLASRYGQVPTDENLAPVKMPGRFVFHPAAAEITLNGKEVHRAVYEAVSKAVYEEVYGAEPGVSLGLAANSVYQAVYAAIKKKDLLPLAAGAAHQAIAQAIQDPDFNPTLLIQSVHEAVGLAEQTLNYEPLFNTVNQAVYQAVYSGRSSFPPLTIDAIYSTLYQKPELTVFAQAVETVNQAVYAALPPLGGGVSWLDELYQSVYASVYDASLGSDLPPGTFTSFVSYYDWYRLSGRFQEGAPWAGIVCYNTYFINNDLDMCTALLDNLEKKGVNVLLAFTDADRKALLDEFFLQDGRSRVGVLITCLGFNFIYGRPEAGIELFKQLNVPVLAPVYSSDLEEWRESFSGITGDVYWQIAYPELDGRIEPVLVGGSKVIKVDEHTGAILEKKVPLPDRIERVAGRALAWINLRRKDNHEKKIALIYYNYHAGKDDIGASYLNVFASAAQILKALREDGYRVDGDLSAGAIEEIIRRQGRNVGSWAPGELVSLVEAGASTLPVKTYLSWYNELPEEMRAAVEKEWGPPPGKIMVYNGNFVLPGAFSGNVFLGAQPVRGWGDDPAKITHSPELVPHHQYLAFYLWLQKEFGADAVIHLGTHGTLEWLPRRSVGLGEDDWPDLLIGNMPDIYPYIVNNPGEATQAKRRGYAVIIDHLTPPMIKPELYGELAEIQRLTVDYREALQNNETGRAAGLREQIIQKSKALHIDQDLGLDLENTDFSRVVEILHEYLEELAGELMPYGLHTFGLPPQGEMLSLFTEAIIDFDREAREGSRAEIREKLLLTNQEIENMLRALRGEYVEPGLGRDPVRVPAALPTGRNLVTFDPRMVPDQVAWNTGKQAADQLLAEFYAAQGHYPETIGVVLWAIETMRTQGETVALILRLIGAEPVWDKSGRVNSVKVTPLEELGRPRINVLVTISGLFRDTFAHTIGVLDEAFRQVALLAEDQQKNLVRKTYLSLKNQLIEQGLTEKEADYLAMSRIFGDAPGTYGTGVADLAQSTAAWQKPEELVNTYIERMAYTYGKDAFGLKAVNAFKEILKSVESVVQVRDSLYGVLDNDDVAQYLGGLRLAAKTVSGKDVLAYIVNTRNGGAPRVQTLEHFVGTELHTRLFNPKWIEGMLKDGYAGSRAISEHVANLFLMDVTTESIASWAWQQVAETYAFNEEIRRRLDPFAAQAIIGWALEAARRQLWPADEQTLSRLSDLYVQMAAQYGVVCCHHTCANLVFNEWVASYSTQDQNVLSRFQTVFNQATQKNLNIAQRKTASVSRSSSSPKKELVAVTVPEQKQVEEKALEKETQEERLNKKADKVEQPVPVEKEMPAGQSEEMFPATRLPLTSTAQQTRERNAQETSPRETVSGAGPEKSAKKQPPEQGGQPKGKAYEVKIKDNIAAGSRNAVMIFALIAALGLVAFLAKGYFSRPG